MDFVAVVDQAIALLHQRGRLTYRTLQLQFQLDDVHLEALKDELIKGQRLATDEDGAVLVWTGDPATPVSPAAPASVPAPPPAASAPPDAERRQLTVLFCDLVDSTRLASQLDPEDLREVVRAYQDTCAKVIARFDGHIAQYLGDGLLVYFGYPRAHEDDAQRAVRAGLGMLDALGQLNTRLAQEQGVQLAVRLGVHTGLVVVGDVGGGTRQEQLALGETPNLAARLQGIAAPNTLVISAATFQLLGGFFACQPLGTPLLKGFAQPLAIYHVLYESMARSRLEAAGSTGWTPLVGREQEIGLLLERWTQVKDGLGQVVLLSGEAGIGKSRLVQVLKAQVASEPQAWLTPCQCSPYYQHTALYPMIEMLERVALRFEREESPPQKLRKLEGFVVQYGLPLAETVPLFATLLSLPLPTDYAPVTGSPEQQKQQTLRALLTILMRIATQQPVLFVVEDLHWVDPTTLELLTLLVDQGPTARILALWTFRPDFSPPWTGRAHLTQVTLPRLPRQQATVMADRVAHGKALPAEVVEQVVAKTDGVPLFVEELIKMVLESGLLQEREERYELTGPLPPLAIPATLHDSLMARLDRLAAVKSLAQLGATLGREFSYELLHAVAPWDEGTVQRGLQQLVEAEFLYQQGLPPQATYVFKHALIQDAAYQSLLRSTRQQYHQRIVHVLEAGFPATCKTQPEVLAHHCTEAGLHAQALGYWQQAGQRAIERSANLEAVSHLTRGLAVLATLPETSERLHQEMDLHLTLGPALMATRGYGAPEVGHTYARAHALGQHGGDPQQQFQALWGLWRFHVVAQAVMQARPLADQLFALAQQAHDPACLLAAQNAVGITLFYLGEFTHALTSFEAAIALYDPEQHRVLAFRYGQDPGVICYAFAALTLWMLGYPDQSLQRSQAALAHAQDPFSRAYALFWTALPPQFCGRRQTVSAQAATAVALSTEQQFSLWKEGAMMLQGWAQAHQGHAEEGRAQVSRGLTHWRATGAQRPQPYLLALLGDTYQCGGHVHDGLTVIAEALTEAARYGERWWEAELHRLQGALLLAQRPRREAEAEACFQQALTIAAGQQARSLALRAAVSLGRLWQHQGQHERAMQLLAPRYSWFTEGFETADVTEARLLLEELSAQH